MLFPELLKLISNCYGNQNIEKLSKVIHLYDINHFHDKSAKIDD